MRRQLALVALAIAATLAALALTAAAPTAHANPTWTSDPDLDDVASWIAMRQVSVRCYARDEPDSPWGYGAWGYVRQPLGRARVAHLDGRLCAGALDVNAMEIPRWQRALGVVVVTHEAYHLRRWGAAGDEAKVECKAIRHWRFVAARLGATVETIDDLWPTALAAHYQIANWTDQHGERPYHDPTCRVPRLVDLPDEERERR